MATVYIVTDDLRVREPAPTRGFNLITHDKIKTNKVYCMVVMVVRAGVHVVKHHQVQVTIYHSTVVSHTTPSIVRT